MILLGFATLGASMFWSVNVALIPPLLEKITSSATLIGFALSLGAIAGVIMPIFAGLVSDRIETPWGKRRTFILFGGITASLAVIFIPVSRIYVLTLLILTILYMALNSYISPVFAFIPDVVPENQRGQAAGVYGVLRGVGTLLGFALGGYLWRFDIFKPFLATGLIVLITALITVVGTANYDVISGDSVPNEEIAEWKNLKRYFKSLTKYPAAMSFFCAQSLWWAGFGVAIPFFTLFAKNVLGISVSSSASILTVFGIITIVAMIPVGKLGDKLDPWLVMDVGLSILGVSAFLGYFVQNLAQVYLVMIFSAVGVSALTTLPFAFIAQVSPEGRKAEFYGLDNISISAPQIIALLLGGILIDYVGYRIIFLIASVAVFLSIIVLFFGERGLQNILKSELGR
jgi:MFS family permease